MEPELEQMEKLAEKVYNLSSILKRHCRANEECLEEVSQISTLADYLHNDADKLYSNFINLNSPA